MLPEAQGGETGRRREKRVGGSACRRVGEGEKRSAKRRVGGSASGRNGSADRRVGGSASGRNGSACRRVGEREKRVGGSACGVSAGRRAGKQIGETVYGGPSGGKGWRMDRRIGEREKTSRRIKLCLFDRSSFLALRSPIVIVLELPVVDGLWTCTRIARISSRHCQCRVRRTRVPLSQSSGREQCDGIGQRPAHTSPLICEICGICGLPLIFGFQA